MPQVLTKEIAYEALQNFFINKPFVLFGTGPSIAMDKSFGMENLKKFLCERIPGESLTGREKKEWDRVVEALDRDNNLESALNEVKEENLIKKIIGLTFELLGKLNKEYNWQILSGKKAWTALPLFKRLVNGLPETDRILHTATTNYDLLAEYAFEREQIPYITGFFGGVYRRLDWKQALQSMTYIEMEKNPRSKKIKKITKIKKYIRLYKVHGSLNTFMLNNEIVENNYWMQECPRNIERVMIMPGAQKYARLHDYRQALLNEYDYAIEKHNAFLFIGFGFNDDQLINHLFKKKLINHKCPALIITRDSNKKIENLLSNSDNIWLICKQPGGGEKTTMICNSGYNDNLYLDSKQLWDASQFAAEILGG
jgi:hypothetical protein